MVGTLSPSAGGAVSILGQGAGIPHVLRPESQGIEQKQCCNRFNGDFEGDPHQRKKKKFVLLTQLRINDGILGKCSL